MTTWIDKPRCLPPGVANELIHELADPLIACGAEDYDIFADLAFRTARDHSTGLWLQGLIEWRQIDLAGVRIYLAALRRARAVIIATNSEGGHA